MTTEINDSAAIGAQVRAILTRYGRLSKDVDALADDDSLSEAGMTSHASVNVMLALEAEFGEIPDDMLTRSVFHSIATIARAMKALQGR